MKKLIGLIFTTIFTILLCVCTYAKVSSNFSTNLYSNDKYYSQYLDNENAIKYQTNTHILVKEKTAFT